MKFHYLFFPVLISITAMINAQYNTKQEIAARLNSLKQKTDIASVSSIAKTSGGNEIIVAIVGKGDKDNKPGIAVIGGVNGPSLASTEIVMQMMEKIVSQKPAILDEVSFYFFPQVSPDASSQYFEPLKYERKENARPTDDDRDGKTDEDGYDDLNNDGFISWMRIKDPVKGEWIVHPDNPAIMVKADITKNEKGEYIVMKEGFDNDKDGKINEDLPGGVIFNKNFSYNYPYFGYGAGENAVSEEESRGIAKFLFDHWNIFAVLIIGHENNLSGFCDLKTNFTDKKIISSVSEKDKSYFEAVVNLYNNTVKLGDPSPVAPSGGDMLSWAYFHYNRFAFSTPGWNVEIKKNNKGSAESDYLAWASGKGLTNLTTEWQKVSHPDFPGKNVEVGGIKPFLTLNPPIQALDTVSDHHLDFLVRLAGMHPALSFNEVKITDKKGGMYMIETELSNTGKFPTVPYLAPSSTWVKKVRLDISLSRDQQIIGGNNVFLFNNIVPGEPVKATWLIIGKGKITLKAGSPQTGFITKNIDLN
jgi:hypothetical protein